MQFSTRSAMQPVVFSFSGATSDIRSGKIYAGKIELTALDAIIVRDLGPAEHNGATLRFDILCQLRDSGVAVINLPEAIARAVNKYVSSCLFQKNGIPTPQTVVTGEVCPLTREQERIALKAATVTGTVYAGVDIIEGDSGCDGGDRGICVESGIDGKITSSSPAAP